MRTVFLLSLLTLALASADTITMKNGRILNGTYLGGNAREIRIDMGDHIEIIPIDRVATLQFDSSAPAEQAAPASQGQQGQQQTEPSNADSSNVPQPAPVQSDSAQPAPPPAADQQSNSAAASPSSGPTLVNSSPSPTANNAPPPAETGGIVIPQGSQVTVRMIDAVDSENARIGDRFRASMAEPVIVNGQTVIPRGSDVTVRLMDDQQSGRVTGKTVLTLGITSITINGNQVPVSTSDVSEASSSRGARSGKVIGGATALGAIIGAVAGGGKGAAIGAGSGAAIGAGAELATKGQRVKVPSETRLTFTLSHDVQI